MDPVQDPTLSPPAGRALRASRWTPRLALAAVAVAIALALGHFGSGPSITTSRGGLTYASGELARALDIQLAQDRPAGYSTRVMLSFSNRDGEVCRGFARSDLSGIACHGAGGWHLYVQRDGVDLAAGDARRAQAIDAQIDAAARAMAAGPVFDDFQEREARADGWRGQ
jgi:hypothetical protein